MAQMTRLRSTKPPWLAGSSSRPAPVFMESWKAISLMTSVMASSST